MNRKIKSILNSFSATDVKFTDSKFVTTRYEAEFFSLPSSFDGFKIAHLSDFHSQIPYLLIKTIESEKPDIIAITGDILDDKVNDVDTMANFVGQLLGIAPVYFCSGNHDVGHKKWQRFLHSINAKGAIFCDDSLHTITKNGDEIAIFGIADPFGKTEKTIEKSLKASLDSLPEYDGFSLLLFHRANEFEKIAVGNFDLVLSGHMHGGQVQIPGVGGLLPPKSSLFKTGKTFFPKYCNGLYRRANTYLEVSCGLSNTLPVPRLFNPPELCIFTLRCE